jgi:hypothetical protein
MPTQRPNVGGPTVCTLWPPTPTAGGDARLAEILVAKGSQYADEAAAQVAQQQHQPQPKDGEKQ